MGKRGPKLLELDWSALDALLQFKVSLAFCADYLNISHDVIEKRIRKEYDMTFSEYHGLKMQRTGVKLQQKCLELALGGNVTLMIFALKNLAMWSDKMDTTTQIKDTVIQLAYKLEGKDENGK
jgi:hypothetical protein